VRHAFVTAEDRRFYSHGGFDPVAVARAFADSVAAGRVVSGASTITQQLARLTRPRERTLAGKVREILRATAIEEALTKEEILGQYLNRVPLGRNVRGVEAAARSYFGKPVSRLTPLEGAVLASLPRAPGRLDPYGENRQELERRGRSLVERMAAAGRLTAAEAAEARTARLAFSPFGLPFRAPHLVDRLLAGRRPSPGIHRTAIDLAAQDAAEGALRSHAARLASRGVTQGAAVVVENGTREVVAYVGSLAYGPTRGGFCDGASMRRSAGSTVKPFLYARALEAGQGSATLLPDTAKRYRSPRGDFSPDNFDRVEYGPVTVRTALANSLNLSAVAALDRLGVPAFHRTLLDLSLVEEGKRGPEELGLGLAVGNAEVTLAGLAAAYATLADGGRWKPLRFLPERGGEGRPVFFPETAFLVTDILSDPAARMVSFGAGLPGNVPYPYALKTGTSTRFRDGWAVAYTARHTVAVWVGNFDGSPTAGISGGWGASPIAGEILRRLGEKEGAPPPFRPPAGVARAEVCGISGMAPSPGCVHVTREWFPRGGEPDLPCTLHGATASGGAPTVHRLPAPYARWVAARERRGASGRYALDGGLSPAPFDPAPWEGAGAGETADARPRRGERAVVGSGGGRVFPTRGRIGEGSDGTGRGSEGAGSPSAGGGTGAAAGIREEGRGEPGPTVGRGGPSAAVEGVGSAPAAGAASAPANGTASGGPFPARGRIVTADDGAGPGMRPSADGPCLEIAYPLPRDRFVLDRSAVAPAIRLDALLPTPAPYVEWFVDGRLLARTAPPYSAWWTLVPGVHRITASAPGLAGDSVRVAVE
jgi:penicillin-binding protein 1C